MKKLVFAVVALTSMATFANEIENKEIVSEKIITVKNTVEIKRSSDSLEELLRYCVTRVNYWYEYSYVGMDGNTYDVFTQETTTTCYTN